MDFRHQDSCWDDDTVKEKCNPVSDNLPHKEEAVDKMKLLPD